MLPAAEVALGLRRDLLRKAGKGAQDVLMLMLCLAGAQVALAYLSERASVSVLHRTTSQE